MQGISGVKSAAVTVAGLCLLAGCARFEAKPLLPDQTAAEFEARSLDNPDLRKFIEQNRAPFEVPPSGGKDLSDPRKHDTPNKWDLDTLTLVALYYHPSLDVARAQWAVAQAGIKTAGQRPNPAADLAPQYTTNSPSGESPWVATLIFDGIIETAGKRGYRIEEAKAISESARLKLAAQAWQVRSGLRTSLLDYAAARQRIVLLQNVREAQQQLLKLLEGRLKAGAIAAGELVSQRVALIRTQADLADAQRQVVDGRAAVAQALGVPLQALEGQELTFDLGSKGVSPLRVAGILPAIRGRDALDTKEQGQDALATTEARRQALHRRADILAALADYAASQSALQLEIARQYPDIRLGPGYEFDQGLHKWGLAVGTDFLPVFNRNQGPIAEAEAKRAEAATRFLALQAQVIGEIDRGLAGVAASRDQLRQIDTLLDTQRKNVQAVEAMVKAGAADQSELRTAQLEVATAESTRLDALVKVQQALGQLEDAMQQPFNALGLPNAESRVGGPLPSVEQDPRSEAAKENQL
jgi:cobalt-zinc-cadmium efflux system outer membrane protein